MELGSEVTCGLMNVRDSAYRKDGTEHLVLQLIQNAEWFVNKDVMGLTTTVVALKLYVQGWSLRMQ